jgi:hypothetical protein
MARKTKLEQSNSARSMALGLRKHFAGKTLQVSNKQTKVADALALFDALETQAARVAAAYAAWITEVAAERTLRTKRVAPLLLGLQNLMRVHFGKRNPILLDFGISPSAPSKPTAVVRLAGLAKARVTRDARGTAAKRRRKRR